jgi:hypothetical protein
LKKWFGPAVLFRQSPGVKIRDEAATPSGRWYLSIEKKVFYNLQYSNTALLLA